MFLLLSLVCLSVSTQIGKVRSWIIDGVSMDWYKDKTRFKEKFGLTDKKGFWIKLEKSALYNCESINKFFSL